MCGCLRIAEPVTYITLVPESRMVIEALRDMFQLAKDFTVFEVLFVRNLHKRAGCLSNNNRLEHTGV